jgi:hypothetical protein
MLKRKEQQTRRRARMPAKRDIPRVGDIIAVTDDGTKVRAIIVGSPRYTPPDAAVLGWYMVEADEAWSGGKLQLTITGSTVQARGSSSPLFNSFDTGPSRVWRQFHLLAVPRCPNGNLNALFRADPGPRYVF